MDAPEYMENFCDFSQSNQLLFWSEFLCSKVCCADLFESSYLTLSSHSALKAARFLHSKPFHCIWSKNFLVRSLLVDLYKSLHIWFIPLLCITALSASDILKTPNVAILILLSFWLI